MTPAQTQILPGNPDMKNEVFTVKDGEFQIRINGEVLPTVWNSRGAALAGMRTEMQRRGIHETTRQCWCKPYVLEQP